MAERDEQTETGGDAMNPVALIGTAVDLALGVVALGADSLRALPELAVKLPVRAASAALVAGERAAQEYGTVLRRGAELRGTLTGLLAGRLLGPPIVEDEPADVDPFDLLFTEQPGAEDLLDGDPLPEPPKTPFVVVGAPVDLPVQPAHGELPLADFDAMTIGVLRVAARPLDIADLELLLAHERGSGRRDGVLSLLETRIAQLQQESSAG